MRQGQNLKKSLQMTAFILKQCRRFGLLYNERTTILTHSDELQLIQYCLACFKQKNKESFDAPPAETLDVAAKIQNIQIGALNKLLQKCKVTGEQETHRDSIYLNLSRNCDTLNAAKSNVEKSMKESQEKGESEAELKAVFALFVSHKETSNQQSILDCHMRFVQEITNCQSDLHLFIKSCEDMKEFDIDRDPLAPIQVKICDVLKQLNPSFFLDISTVDDALDAESNLMDQGIPEHPKTPSRAKLLDNCNSPVCSPLQFSTPRTPATPAEKKKLRKIFVHDLFRCYIHLLVNSRSQLSLARIFNIPERGLDHAAFTHVKHESLSAGLSMYQFLASFIMRIRLGGQGYAPSASTPLMSYIKGLGCLLDFTQKLQTVVEEVTDVRSACVRVVNIIKNNLTQCKSGKFTRRLVEPCALEIQTSLAAIIDDETTAEDVHQSQTNSTGGSLLGRHCLRVLQTFLDQASVQESSEADNKMLQDLSFSSHTPTRIPCLLSQFRSPCMLEIVRENTEIKAKQFPRAVKKVSSFVSSAFYLEEEDGLILTQGTLSSVEVLPSKTLVDRKACDNEANLQPNKLCDNSKQHQTKIVRKRKVLTTGKENVESCPAVNKLSVLAGEEKQTQCTGVTSISSIAKHGQSKLKSNKAEKSCRKRLLPQVKGQSKITGFFKM